MNLYIESASKPLEFWAGRHVNSHCLRPTTMSTSLQSARSAPPSDQTSFQTVQLPIEGPVSDVDEAVQKLKQCAPSELQRARRHHRRALEALHTGGYKSLTGNTRQQLIRRLQRGLEALNRALDALTTDRRSEPQDGSRGLSHETSSSLVQEVLPWNW